jgi:DMSO/TMAO reductase YedYZ molybdopterin-dependent catalytic subunit
MQNPDLIVRRADPLNCEVALPRLILGAVTPNDRFYIRSHFPVPATDPERWHLRVHGLVKTPLELSLRQIRRMPSQKRVVTLECAGNGRSFFDPPIEGEQWALGAVSTAEWKGVSLSAVLRRAGLPAGATHLVFRGADGPFERGLSLADARHAHVLLAYAMNGKPLPAHHGNPLRVIVPGWYGVASVKWLTEIEVTGGHFEGYFQTERYIYGSSEAVTQMRVRSLITTPVDHATVGAGKLVVRGLAWSGWGRVARVELAVDGGPWRRARLFGSSAHAWRRWEQTVQVGRSSQTVIRSRATDASGATQPDQAAWNPLGYGNNSIQLVTIAVS